MVINGGGSLVSLVNDAAVSYNKNTHSVSRILNPSSESVIMLILLRIQINVPFSLKDLHLIGIQCYLILIKFLKGGH